jgi:hypothetical protein
MFSQKNVSWDVGKVSMSRCQWPENPNNRLTCSDIIHKPEYHQPSFKATT